MYPFVEIYFSSVDKRLTNYKEKERHFQLIALKTFILLLTGAFAITKKKTKKLYLHFTKCYEDVVLLTASENFQQFV